MPNVEQEPTNDTIPAPVIEAGRAQMALMAASANAAKALGELEAVANAIARALDATAATQGAMP